LIVSDGYYSEAGGVWIKHSRITKAAQKVLNGKIIDGGKQELSFFKPKFN